MSLNFNLRALFALVALAAVFSFALKIYFTPRPERRVVIVHKIPESWSTATGRSIGICREGWSESYLDFPPYGSPDAVYVHRNQQHFEFYSGTWAGGGKIDFGNPKNKITPEMQEDFDDLLAFLEKENGGVPIDQFFKELKSTRFFPLKPGQLTKSKGNPP